MNEAETRAELIDPALAAAGWGVVTESRVRREVQITLGRLQGAGTRRAPQIADYVLVHRGQRLAVVEAKSRDKGPTEGVAQAKLYAEKLQTRFAFATNGDKLYRIDMATGAEAYVEAYPSPAALWSAAFGAADARTAFWRERFSSVPFEDKSGSKPPYYYQVNAVEKTLAAIAEGRDRILLTLATGTGKTYIAFQLAWKLFHSRWNLTDWKGTDAQGMGEPARRPRILFLADRNNLADQALKDFSAFPDDALKRIKPDGIRKDGRVPKNGSVFFTIFQTFTSGKDPSPNPLPQGERAFASPSPLAGEGRGEGSLQQTPPARSEGYFGDYPPDFFDLIIIDECHRGGAADESSWRGILEYFAPAVQLGLTATPKRQENADTYAYFGQPVYTYSLKQGIEDGFLTPFKVRQFATTLDDYVWTADDLVVEGVPEEGRRYREGDFNRIIEIPERERYRVRTVMGEIDQREKTLVFCQLQAHAAVVSDLINQLKTSPDPNYCVRVTAADGEIGDQHLKAFQDNEKTIPTLLTTSQKLSTGVDARNVRNIVLLRPVNSMIEFKQIIGRGTRLYDGKDFFTIYDFVKAYEHFSDPEWDGEPLEPVARPPVVAPEGEAEPEPPATPEGEELAGRPARIVITLADGKARTIQHIAATTFWGPDGKPLSAQQFVESLFGRLPELFKDAGELRRLWSAPDTRSALLAGLAERGFGASQLADIRRIIAAEQSDVFDVLGYVAFALPPMSRAERVEQRKAEILARYDGPLGAFLDFVLGQYVSQGVGELEQRKLPDLLELKYHTVNDAAAALGGIAPIRDAFLGFQRHLFGAAQHSGLM
ncbi:MAG TPA: DEAD/DEAH box helicase family protein [Acetobacteraceae bacterium]|nr:DEAD/DEAH box helicase family protein [Acetobacteraceae bacterium]